MPGPQTTSVGPAETVRRQLPTQPRNRPEQPLAGQAAAVPVAASSSLPAHDAVTGLLRIQAELDQCLLTPTRCNVDRIAVPGSPAHRFLADLVAYYVTNGLVARVVPELSYVVVEHVQAIGPDRVEITLCEADGSWQMDSRGTAFTGDDIVWDDLVVSRRAQHTLVRTAGEWRRFAIVELQLWLGEQRCPARSGA